MIKKNFFNSVFQIKMFSFLFFLMRPDLTVFILLFMLLALYHKSSLPNLGSQNVSPVFVGIF